MHPSPHARFGRAVAIVLAVAVLAPLPALAHGTDQDALESARDEVAAVEQELEGARGDADAAESALREADARLARLERAVNDAGQALYEQELHVRDTEERVRALQANISAQQDAFATRAASMYKRGAGVPFEAVLAAGSMDDAIQRSAYVQAISSSDEANLEGITTSRVALSAERDRLAEERDRLARMKAEQEALLAKVEELRGHRAMKLAAARRNVESLEARKEDLEAESSRIEALIRERERAAAARARAQAASASAGAPPSEISGASGYAWPRCDTVTSEYGWRWGRRHEGLDIDGNTGSPIYASKAGVVIFAGWQGGYGRLTLIDHGDGVVTAYAHQSSQNVGSGQQVSQGAHIGAVGSTGHSTGSHLHFETRVHGSPVNPRRFLPASC